MKRIIHSGRVPEAIGPYSQAVEVNGVIYTSGMIPIDPRTGEVVEGTVVEQATQAMSNLKTLLEESGSGMGNVMKTTVFIKDMGDFPKVNEVYARFFEGNYPARSCVEVARLPKDVLIEIEAVASMK